MIVNFKKIVSKIKTVSLTTLIVTILFFILYPFSKPLGYPFFDFLSRNIQKNHNSKVALIYVDQASIERMFKDDGLPFPWPREYYGAIIKVANHLRAQLVYFDILFTETSSKGVEDDQRLAKMIMESKIPILLPAADFKGSIRNPVKVINDKVQNLGTIHIRSSSDGVYREIQSKLKSSDGKLVATIPYLSAKILNYSLEEKKYIHFYNNPWPIVSFYNVIRAYRLIEEGKKLPKEILELKNKIWFIGLSAPGLLDLKPSPINPRVPGVFILAQALMNRILGHGHNDPSFGLKMLLILLGSFLVILVGFISKKPLFTINGLVLTFVIYPLLSSFTLWSCAIFLNPVPLILALLLLSTFILILRFQREWKESLRMAKGLEYSMSKEMLKLIINGDINNLRFAQKKEVTILFSDLAGFTEISEKLSPDELVEILNLYYDEVVDLIFSCNGYIDKFIGDAVMAIWGTPLELENHAGMGLLASIKYQKQVDNLNKKLHKINSHFPKLYSRVGIHSGSVVVGNIGSSKRFNYTVIGDAVNLASRLESIGQQYHCSPIISESTYNLAHSKLKDNILLIDKIIVKGQTKAINIYTCTSSEIINNYQVGFKLYQEKKFQKALKFFDINQNFGPAIIMAQRCKNILDNGIPANLINGAWRYETK